MQLRNFRFDRTKNISAYLTQTWFLKVSKDDVVVLLHTEFHVYDETLQVAFTVVNNQWFTCDPKLWRIPYSKRLLITT